MSTSGLALSFESLGIWQYGLPMDGAELLSSDLGKHFIFSHEGLLALL